MQVVYMGVDLKKPKRETGESKVETAEKPTYVRQEFYHFLPVSIM